MRVELYHYGFQCPWVEYTDSTLQTLCGSRDIVYEKKDIQKEKYNCEGVLVFPFNVLVNGEIITGSPITKSNFNDLFTCACKASIESEESLEYDVLDDIQQLTEITIDDSIKMCTGTQSITNSKKTWYIENKNRIFGFIGYKDKKPVSMIDLVNASDCPYTGIRRSKKAAVILCVYSQGKYDYRTDLITKAEVYLSGRGYTSVEIIVGENGYYPNGPKSYFEALGFLEKRRIGEIYLLNRGNDTVYLMRKAIT